MFLFVIFGAIFGLGWWSHSMEAPSRQLASQPPALTFEKKAATTGENSSRALEIEPLVPESVSSDRNQVVFDRKNDSSVD